MHSVAKTWRAWRSTSSTSCRWTSSSSGGTPASTSVRQAMRRRDAERGLVGPVAADVADDGVHGAARRLHRVEEVAAEQRAAAAGLVVRGERERRVA